MICSSPGNQLEHMTFNMNQLKLSPVILHQQLGHPSPQTVSLINKQNTLNLNATIIACTVAGKSCKLPFLDSHIEYHAVLECLKWTYGDLHLFHPMVTYINLA